MKKFWIFFAITAVLLIALSPFFWMIVTAFKPEPEALTLRLLPQHPTLSNFKDVLLKYNFFRYFKNSLIIATLASFFSTLFAAMAAYAFAKKDFYGKNVLFALFLSSMMVPGLLYVVPQFVIVFSLGWINSFKGMIIPHLANVFGLFMLVQFMKSLPDELLEAAKMDGASEWLIFSKIVVPLTLPAIATVMLLNFQFHWNNFLWQLLVAQDESLYTLPVGLAMFKSAHEEAFALKMAASTIAVLPITVLFLFAQRYFIEGITHGAVKG